ncbi:MAG: CheR family methyltransferase [Desulfonatronovibrionaceae bacterium]
MSMKISQEDLRLFAQYIYNLTAISLDESKGYLLENRFKGLMDREKATSFRDLYNKARADKSGRLEKAIIDAITTKETLFFRDKAPFELLKHKIIPDLIDRRGSAAAAKGSPVKIRIWSAACSTGQEVYSIAIALREVLPDLNKYQVSILGTDISDEAIARASYGKYNSFEIERGMAGDSLRKYFNPTEDGQWRIKDEIRAMAVFKKQNLMRPFSGFERYDIIFCRNVAIYFSSEDKKNLFERLAGVLERDGYLIIGSTESLTGVTDKLVPKRYMRAIYYQPAGFKE